MPLRGWAKSSSLPPFCSALGEERFDFGHHVGGVVLGDKDTHAGEIVDEVLRVVEIDQTAVLQFVAFDGVPDEAEEPVAIVAAQYEQITVGEKAGEGRRPLVGINPGKAEVEHIGVSEHHAVGL